MMGSILRNPQLFYSAALGVPALIIRFVCCFLCGIAAGLLVRVFFKNIGVVLSALFQRYVPEKMVVMFFGGRGSNLRGFGVLTAATIGAPLYVCGDTVPLLIARLEAV
jgi:uncharacterized membrane protein YraQ (UPF0718 family)